MTCIANFPIKLYEKFIAQTIRILLENVPLTDHKSGDKDKGLKKRGFIFVFFNFSGDYSILITPSRPS